MTGHDKDLLTKSDVNIREIKNPASARDALEQLKHMRLPPEIVRAVVEAIYEQQPGFCLPWVDGDGKKHAFVYSDCNAMYRTPDSTRLRKHDGLLKEYIHQHETGHSLDPKLWKSLAPHLFGGISWTKPQEQLRAEQQGDVYAILHTIAAIRPSLAETQEFLKDLIAWRRDGISPMHQTAPILAALLKRLPELHAKITANPNKGSRHAQATAYTRQLIMNRVPSHVETEHAAITARQNYYSKMAANMQRHRSSQYAPASTVIIIWAPVARTLTRHTLSQPDVRTAFRNARRPVAYRGSPASRPGNISRRDSIATNKVA